MNTSAKFTHTNTNDDETKLTESSSLHSTTLNQSAGQQQLQFESQDQVESVAPPGGDRFFHASSHPSGQLPEASALVQQQQQSASSKQPLVRTVNPGDRVNIPCSLANMGGSIQFAKDDQPIVLNSDCAHCQLDISNDGQASLTINRVGQRDQGHWQCWRLDSQGKVKQSIVQLVVTNSPELPILVVNDKELLGGNNLDATITIKENELVTFKCVIKGASTPVDYVHWILDSSTNVTQMSQLMMEYSALDNNYLTQSVLKLNASKSMNMKSISCLSNHQLWLTPMTVTALMNVLYEPSFTISREPGFGVPVSEGMAVTLKCEIDSNPPSTAVWIKDADNKTSNSQANNEQQQINGKEPTSQAEPIVLANQEEGSVVFAPARQSDTGWYRCKTENKYGNFSSFGYYLNVRSANLPPAAAAATTNPVKQPPSGFPRPRSDSRVMGPNQPTIQGNGPAANSVTNQRPVAEPSLSSIAAGNLQRDQPQHLPHAHHTQPPQTSSSAADERCRSSSNIGAPDIKTPALAIQTQLGRQLTLPLRFCCQPGPARVFWIHRHLAMIPGRMFGPYITRDVYPSYAAANCYETTFEIEQVKPEDIGTVYVFVSNEKGHAGAQIHIQLAKQVQTPTAAVELHHPQYNSNQANTLNSFGSRFAFNAGASSSPTPISKLQFVLLTLVLLAAGALVQLGPIAASAHYQIESVESARLGQLKEQFAPSSSSLETSETCRANSSQTSVR